MKPLFFIQVLLLCLLPFKQLSAQSELNQPNLRFSLSDDNSSYAGLVMVNQIWTRFNQNNPDISGNYPENDIDVALRRSRLIFYTQLMDKVFIYTQVGADGLNFRNTGSPGVSLYNAETEYFLVKDKLHLGFGLNTWNGVSRYNNSKLLEFLLLDSPGFAYPTGGKFDRFGRQLGIYAKGTLNKFHYRIALSRPFDTNPVSNALTGTTERSSDELAFKGYFVWQFLDTENHGFPYMTMNNLGRARILNLGAGFYHHANAMQTTGTAVPENHDVLLFSTDLFLDLPIGDDQAFTSYLGYFNYDFGPDYIRSAGTMNIASFDEVTALAQGGGIAEWEIGTGQIIHGEAGYLLPFTISDYNIQPYGSITYKDFEALDESSTQMKLGVNFMYQRKHNLKWTLQYANRPVYLMENNQMKVSEYRGQLLLQTQIWF